MAHQMTHYALLTHMLCTREDDVRVDLPRPMLNDCINTTYAVESLRNASRALSLGEVMIEKLFLEITY